ncbi:MAG: hypothetical protein E4H02_03605 [Lentisphaerales bacterium]|jgi:hypothetical protein|nr:MAG: hypothetical protein E4H02_03605 [Lentisphaerales bacterium]
MPHKSITKALRPAVIACLVLALAGCVTPTLDSLSSCQDPRIGYWAARTTGNETLRDGYMKSIANLELKQRSRPLPDTMQDLRTYLKELKLPVEIDVSYSENSPDLRSLSPTELQKLASFVSTHPGESFVPGEGSSPEWRDELQKISRKMESLQREVTRHIRDALEELDGGDHAAALAALNRAKLLDVDGPDVINAEKKVLLALAVINLPGLEEEIEKKILPQVEAIRNESFGTALSSDAKVGQCLDLLTRADAALLKFRQALNTSTGETAGSPDLERVVGRIEQAVDDATGGCWAEKIRLNADKRLFWAAYEYAEQRAREAAELAPERKALLKDHLASSYGKILSQGAAHYVDQANKHFSRDAYGISLTCCRMAEEMIQFGKDLEVPESREITTWEKRCSASMADAQSKIVDTVQRRLVVGAFTPRSPEYSRLAATVYEKLVSSFSGSSDSASQLAWGVAVEKQDDVDHIRPTDYLVECGVSEFLVIDVAPVEIERAIIKVGRDISQIPNPAYDPKDNSNVPRTIFSQEVYHYQNVRVSHGKNARLKLAVTFTQKGRKKPLLALDKDYSADDNALRGVRLASIEDRLDVPFIGPDRLRDSRDALSLDPWPKATPPNLSSDGEIFAAMEQFAAETIVKSVISLVGSYPVSTLAAEAVRNERLGNNYEAANYWGQCLEYCFKLMSEDSGKSKNAEPISRKDRMLARLLKLSADYWSDCDPVLLRKMPDLWSLAVRSALELEDN